ncbi:Oidioi.mRNA.OKI2018_I69.chr2.g4508.t1.cds [Oikopleura dioica]|uniref:Oidioi.mRNA.OKI2018_I69.chr2.g4508.t1.cds n=1 Tax=Oikopleura dioica TaxID=34765 RepID=A0ABN7T463_OIKDI|nr:Oidioi.mRNA.OKI2018_I69.chr2.g4508.t1.cds [Oikopleura dioica]
MKLAFGLFAFSAAEVITSWCGEDDLNAYYNTTGLDIEYYMSKRKTWANRDPEKVQQRPKTPAHYRDVVKVRCGAQARRGYNSEPLGSWPVRKQSPMIKCTRKGPGGVQKLKPNGRRFFQSKVQLWFQQTCA